MSGNTANIDIPTIIDVVRRFYDEHHVLIINTDGSSGIENNAGVEYVKTMVIKKNGKPRFFKRKAWVAPVMVDFCTLEELYEWIIYRQVELAEQDAEQRKENARINHESANVDIFKQRF